MIVFLQCGMRNRSEDVPASFVLACEAYGIPSRVRSDCGGENFLVGVFMNTMRGVARGSYITGRSVHNQRIERLWRDVHKEVTERYYATFYGMEDSGLLDPDNNLHRYALHRSFLSEINNKLSVFLSGWNSHKIRTSRNRTPNQLFVEGLLSAADNIDSTPVSEFRLPNYDIHERFVNRLAELSVDVDGTADTSEADNNNTCPVDVTADQRNSMDLAL